MGDKIATVVFWLIASACRCCEESGAQAADRKICFRPRGLFPSDKPSLQRSQYRPRAVAYAELRQNIGNVVAHRTFAQA